MLTWELRYPQKGGVNRKREVLEVALPERRANNLPWGRKRLRGGQRVRGNYKD